MYMDKNELTQKNNFNLMGLQNQVMEAALEVQKNIGPGFSSKDYCRALAYELKLRGIPYESEKSVNLPYKGNIAGQYQLDFVVDGRMIVTILSAEEISDSDQSKLRSFLKALNLQSGIVVNFASEKVEIKAVHR